MQCPECDKEVREFERHCPTCDHDCGYPNVRAAQKPEEQTQLARRVQAAEAEAASKGTTAVLEQFRQVVSNSKAVLCSSLSQTMELASSDNELYASFYQLVGAERRRPEDTDIERARLIADDLLFPHYKEQIRFLALSLDRRGVDHYGDCAVTLKDVAIRNRASVFEENSVYFCKKRDLGINKSLPPGHRATWDQRDRLGIAKLGTELTIQTQASHFPKILLKNPAQGQPEDFIEVHVYGRLNHQAIEQVIARQPKRKADRAILLVLPDFVVTTVSLPWRKQSRNSAANWSDSESH